MAKQRPDKAIQEGGTHIKMETAGDETMLQEQGQEEGQGQACKNAPQKPLSHSRSHTH